MKRIFLSGAVMLAAFFAAAQPGPAKERTETISTKGITEPNKTVLPKSTLPFTSTDFILERNNPATEIKNQGRTGTCWSFSTTSLLESQFIKSSGGAQVDLSEMFTVRNIYVEKAKNYIMRQGHAQFDEGGLGHDVIRSVAKYGAVPESAYPGIKNDNNFYDHGKMKETLKAYLDTLLAKRPLPSDWLTGFNALLDKEIGAYPANFTYNNTNYTPQRFAKEAMKFNANDYVNITSFISHPYYSAFVIDIPDNFSNGAYYNVPLNELSELTKSAVKNGYTVMWDADVSNKGFRQKDGVALYLQPGAPDMKQLTVSSEEGVADEKIRQELFDDLVTQDDHLMHITGVEKSKDGKTFFVVKNSWGEVGPYKGYINVSENYFAMNTVSLVVPKAALSKSMLDKLKLNK